VSSIFSLAKFHQVVNSQWAFLHARVKSKGFKVFNLPKSKLFDLGFVVLLIVQLEGIAQGSKLSHEL
jgi:hypothetical protein